ncbi:MAG: hypothetical protein HQK49_00660 [Oligoflexia bacterium]|nr:hypothetical protein [Oligoflexia bacterium]
MKKNLPDLIIIFCYKTFLYFLWPFFLYPLVNILLAKIIPLLKERKSFENRNKYSSSFKLEGEGEGEGKRAAVTFEVSSEGELEQIRPLVNRLLADNQLLEIIFCSDSVENALLALAERYPANLRILRLPLISFFPYRLKHTSSDWMSSSTLILCRYDFFPELILLGRRPDINFILLSATLKDKEKKLNSKRSLYLRLYHLYFKFIYSSFNQILTATPQDNTRFKKYFNLETATVDFRILQVAERVKNHQIKLQKLPFFKELHSLINSFPKEKTIIFGSFWEIEAQAFEDNDFIHGILNKQIQVTIVPHLLDKISIQKIADSISQATGNKLPIYTIDETNQHLKVETCKIFNQIKEKNGILILGLKGILCELYYLYTHAFVGGGHGRSIHSVIEPYLANCLSYVGPKVFRSTEYDLIKELSPQEINIVSQLPTFYQVITKNININKDIDLLSRENIINNMQVPFDTFLKKITTNATK